MKNTTNPLARPVGGRSLKVLLTAVLFAAALGMIVNEARAQFLGANYAGDFGVLSATQPPVGFYLAPAYVNYMGDKLLDQDGNLITFDPENVGDLNVQAYALAAWWVTDKKIWGANYSLQLVPAFVSGKLEAPSLGLVGKTGTGFTDLYFQPINLGWHTDRADYLAAFGIYAPTGRYSPDADDNLGSGMWTIEFVGGGTWYFDKAKTWSFATTGALEFHGEKKDTDIRVGPIITLEGGLGKSFMDGAVIVGLAYYAQYKIGSDSGTGVDEALAAANLGKQHGWGFGPDITIPIATKSKLYGFVNVRYFWETGVRSTAQGQNLVVTISLPIPSISLK